MHLYITAMKEVWQNDKCHTYDRDNFYAQLECGIGSLDDRLKTAIEYKFNMTYYPFIQDEYSYQCMIKTFPDSSLVVF